MKRHSWLLGAFAGAALLLTALAADAHCDAVDGPVAKAALAALQSENVNLALPYAPAAAEPEIRDNFQAARKARGASEDARVVVDRAFIETVVRLHRAGEGAPYTGLKPAGLDYGPVIPAAEAALETGDASRLKARLHEEIDRAIDERLAAARAERAAPAMASTLGEVAAVRARVSAELGFITFAETLRQASHGAACSGHAD